MTMVHRIVLKSIFVAIPSVVAITLIVDSEYFSKLTGLHHGGYFKGLCVLIGGLIVYHLLFKKELDLMRLGKCDDSVDKENN